MIFIIFSFLQLHKQQKVDQKCFGPITDSAGNLVTERQHMANMVNSFFFALFITNSTAAATNLSDDKSTKEIWNFVFTLFSYEIATEEVLYALQSFKANNSPGPDTINHILLKETKCEILNSLTSKFHMSLRIMLTNWKIANVTSIFNPYCVDFGWRKGSCRIVFFGIGFICLKKKTSESTDSWCI